VIQISPECAKDFVRTCYELAHECIHLLAPSGGPGANVLEGVATFFSSLYVKETFAVDFHPVLESYRLAGELVEKSLASEPDAIRSIRQRQPAFSKVTWTTF
jgi:hypothetical protein